MIASRSKAPLHGGGRLIVDGTDETIIRKAEAAVSFTAGRENRLHQLLALSCEVYNAGLEERIGAGQAGKRVSVHDQYNQLTLLRPERPDVFEFGVQPIRGALGRLDNAHTAYRARVDAGEKAGRTRFRSRSRYDTLSWDEPVSWKLDLQAGTLSLQGVGTTKLSRSALKQFTRLTSRGGVPTTLTLTRKKPGKRYSWRMVVGFKHVAAEKTEPSVPDGIVGLDRGVVVNWATSERDLLTMPRWMGEVEEELKALQREQATKKKRSRAWKELGTRARKLRKKVASKTNEWAKDTARNLVAKYGVLVLEDLQLKNMTKSAKGTVESPGKNVKRKAGLNRSLSEVALGKLAMWVHVKAEEAGRRTWLVNPAHTSQECSRCKHRSEENRPSRDVFYCTGCGHYDHADIQAAQVIRGRGMVAESAWAQAGSPRLVRPKPKMRRRKAAASP